MKRAGLLFVLFLHALHIHAQNPATPDKIYGQLFREVQLSGIFTDSKTFVDAIPKKDPAVIVKTYQQIKRDSGNRFNLKAFVERYFVLPQTPALSYQSSGKDVEQHIHDLWKALKRNKDIPVKGSSLIPLPYSYIVPGGRFREIYYWDSYFTMLGLKESGQCRLMEDMVNNFAYLIQQYGHVPNGNRTYYLSRSQPPFFAHMVTQLCMTNAAAIARFYPAIEKEYRYWMESAVSLAGGQSFKRAVKMEDGTLLNRYWDELAIPRQESYSEDVRTVDTAMREFLKLTLFRDAEQQRKAVSHLRSRLYSDLRAAAASGWDFSSRWLADGQSLASIQTTDIIPVDLNCLLLLSEELVSQHAKDPALRKMAAINFPKRKAAIHKYFWNATVGYFTDYRLTDKRPADALTLAGVFPLFFSLATPQQATAVMQHLRTSFLKDGGFVTTLTATGQQWDAPNGWAPLQWISIKGLSNYGFDSLTTVAAKRWIRLNTNVYKRTGRLMEKYNVIDTTLEAGGGEYPSQDGFGWTNGVLLSLIKQYGRSN